MRQYIIYKDNNKEIPYEECKKLKNTFKNWGRLVAPSRKKIFESNFLAFHTKCIKRRDGECKFEFVRELYFNMLYNTLKSRERINIGDDSLYLCNGDRHCFCYLDFKMISDMPPIKLPIHKFVSRSSTRAHCISIEKLLYYSGYDDIYDLRKLGYEVELDVTAESRIGMKLYEGIIISDKYSFKQ